MLIDRFTQICLWTDESLALALELEDLFRRERVALLHFKGEDLADVTMAKEVVVRKIVALRELLRTSLLSWFGVESSQGLESKLPESQRAEWAGRHQAWTEVWARVAKDAERSQFFLRHSQRNLGRLVDHWRRQIGQAPLYSAKGQKVDAPSTGRVFEAKF